MSNRLLLILIPAFPLAACLITACFGRLLKGRAHLPTICAIIASCLCALLLLSRVVPAAQDAAKDDKRVGYEEVYTLWNWTDIKDAYEGAPWAEPENEQIQVHSAIGVNHSFGLNGTGRQTPPSDFRIDVVLRADPLTCIMLAMVTFVASLVAIYASGYMHHDPGYSRFFAYVSLFVFSMTMLVSVSNFVLLYVFWEAVGACSYLLIGFWYQKPEAVAAGKKAFLVNRIGDVGFALGLFLIWTTYGTLNFHDTDTVHGVLGQYRLGHLGMYAGGGTGLAICLLLLLGACGKRAQFPLHVWLPDAMEGPTPVSALIHAATMVTAGVYMVTRCTPLFIAGTGLHEPGAQHIVALFGGFTALLAGIIAVTQTDLKRVLAYSTVSQLGYMFLALGTGSLFGIMAGMFHLFTHAFFKALLFLGAGSVMHAMGGVIDMRRFGGLKRVMPVTHWTFLIGSLALAGIVPFAGFWSKDQILAAVHERTLEGGPEEHFNQIWYLILYWSAVFTAGLTAFYTFRAYFLTFHGPERIPHEAGHHAHESPSSMTGPLIVLAIGALVVGAYFDLTHQFTNFLKLTPSLSYIERNQPEAPEAFHYGIAIQSTIIALAGIGLAAVMYLGSGSLAAQMAQRLSPLYWLSYGKFFFDQIYDVLVVRPLRMLAAICYWFDRWIVDGLVNLCGAIPPTVGAALRSLQGGMVQFYAMAMALGVLALIGALLFWHVG